MFRSVGGTRAVTETEDIFNLENWQTRGPEVLANEFRDIQEENLRVNKDFYRVIQDALKVGVPKRELKKILRKRGLSQKRTNLLFRGQNIPYSGYDGRMRKRVRDAEKIGEELNQKKSKDFRNYFYPRKLFRLIEREYRKSLAPEERIDRSIIDRVTDYFSEKITPQGETIKTAQAERIQTPPLPPTNMPAQNLMAQSPQKINGLTRSEQALLSPEEKVIAART